VASEVDFQRENAMKKAEKKELKVKKLMLSKETLRLLTSDDLQSVVGGGPPVSNNTRCTDPTCTQNSNSADC
jgi:hypothetical protein